MSMALPSSSVRSGAENAVLPADGRRELSTVLFPLAATS
jgi:hypothetical protein